MDPQTSTAPPVPEATDVQVDLARRVVTRADGEDVRLTSREAALLVLQEQSLPPAAAERLRVARERAPRAPPPHEVVLDDRRVVEGVVEAAQLGHGHFHNGARVAPRMRLSNCPRDVHG